MTLGASFSDIRRLLSAREQRHALSLFGLMLMGAVLEMLGVGAIPAFVAFLSDPEAMLRYGVVRRLAEAFDVRTADRIVLSAAAALLGLFLIKNAYLAGLSWLQARYVFNRQAVIARRLFGAYLRAPYAFHLHRNTAELLRNTNQNAMEVVGYVMLPILTLAMEMLTVTAVLVLLLVVDPLTSFAGFVILGGTTALFLRLVRGRVFQFGQQMNLFRERMIRAVNEGLGGIKVTKVLGREQAFEDQYAQALHGYARASRRYQVMQDVPRLLLETVGVTGLLAVAGLLLARGRDLGSLIPTLTLLGVAVVRMIPSFNRITSALNALRYGRAALEAVTRDLRVLEQARAAEAAEPRGGRLDFERDIRLEHVTFRYADTASPALHDISLVIAKGSAVGVVGTTGSGKTTLVDVLMALHPPTEGRVLVDGVDVHGSEAAWQRQIGYVPQDIYLADDSIRRNVAFGLDDAGIDDAVVWRTLEAAQLRSYVEHTPDGLDTRVGERGVRLSGGQRQRIGIARALYHGPKLLVLDEATSALDHETERAVMDAVEHLRGAQTILVIAHRLTTIASCDTVITLAEGRAHTSEARFPEAACP